jgi:acylphosphatase
MVDQLHIRVEGHVQGVGFRYFVQENGVSLGLAGWVRNRWDGSVEIKVEGDRDRLEQFLGQIRRGPRSSHVSDLHFKWLESESEFQGFRIRQTV